MNTNLPSFKILLVFMLCAQSAISQWAQMNTTPNNHAFKFCFVTDDIGYALMNNGTGIEKTTNGGNSWTTIPLPVDSQQYMGFSFPVDSIGYAVYRDLSSSTDPMKIYRTTNDGVSWQNISPDTTNTGFGNSFLDFVDENTGFWLVGDVLYRTTNAGADWDTTKLGGPFSYISAQSVDFFDANHGVIGLHDGTFAYLGGMLVTNDGGATFTETNLNTFYSVVGAVDQASATTTYAASAGWGSGGFMKLYKSTDNGVSWDTLPINTIIQNPELEVFDFNDELNGVAVINNTDDNVRHVYNTSNGGVTWVFEDTVLVGAYDIELTTSSGYLTGATNVFYKRDNTSVGLSSLNEVNSALLLYPNPVKSGSDLFWESTLNYTEINVVDITGKEVFKSSVLNNKINLNQFNPGVYLVTFTSSEIQQSRVLIVE